MEQVGDYIVRLSTSLISLSPVGIDILLYGLLWTGTSSCLKAINFNAAIISMRCYSFILSIMPVYTWSRNITGLIALLALPILTGSLIMSLSDLHYNTVFFNPIFGETLYLINIYFGFPDIQKYIC